MSETETDTRTGEREDIVATVQGGSEAAFSSLAERHRRELRVHCYRMVGNLDDAEDLVQDTFARAWRGRQGFEGRATFRAWLYRIATNASLDAIKRSQRRVQVADRHGGALAPPSFDDVPWLQPFPDDLLEDTAHDEAGPDAVVVARETIELVFLAAIQHLSPRQRAVVILRDALGWTARETATMLDGSEAAVNSALQRGRARLQALGRPGRFDWSPVAAPTDEERRLVQRYMDAHERADADALIDLLGDDVRFTMPPQAERYEGRAAVAEFFRGLFGPDGPGDWRLVPVRANAQPAVANYVRGPGDLRFTAVTLDVLRIDDGAVVEITTFGADVFAAFGLSPTMEA